MNRRLFDFLTTTLGQHPTRVTAFLDTLDDATAAKLVAAADAGDNRAVLKAMSEQTWGATPGRPAPAPVEPTGSRSPMSFEDRVVNDPNIRRALDSAGVAMPSDPEAVMKAYRGASPKRGRPKKAEDSIRELAKPADQVAAENIAGQFDRAMIPYGTRGPGVAGEMSGPGVMVDTGTEMIPSPPRRVGGQTRALSTVDSRPFRVVDEVPSSRPFPRSKAAAAAAGGAVGVGLMMKGRQNDLGKSGNPADLQDAPVSATSFSDETLGGVSPEAGMKPMAAQEPVDYSLQAREMINKLNAMRRAAGGEVPEAQQMMQEINRLIAMGNEQRRAPSYSHPAADPARDPYQQARNLINQVNNMYRAGYTPNSPEVQRVMAEVRRLQAQGDAIRNRRVG